MKATPAPFVSTMNRFSSIPPYTEGRRRPAAEATSTKVVHAGSDPDDDGRRMATSAQMTMRMCPLAPLGLALQALGDFKFALGRVRTIHLLEQAGQEIVRGLVVGVVVDRAPPHAFRRLQLALLGIS